jgi:hypothetical protein
MTFTKFLKLQQVTPDDRTVLLTTQLTKDVSLAHEIGELAVGDPRIETLTTTLQTLIETHQSAVESVITSWVVLTFPQLMTDTSVWSRVGLVNPGREIHGHGLPQTCTLNAVIVAMAVLLRPLAPLLEMNTDTLSVTSELNVSPNTERAETDPAATSFDVFGQSSRGPLRRLGEKIMSLMRKTTQPQGHSQRPPPAQAAIQLLPPGPIPTMNDSMILIKLIQQTMSAEKRIQWTEEAVEGNISVQQSIQIVLNALKSVLNPAKNNGQTLAPALVSGETPWARMEFQCTGCRNMISLPRKWFCDGVIAKTSVVPDRATPNEIANKRYTTQNVLDCLSPRDLEQLGYNCPGCRRPVGNVPATEITQTLIRPLPSTLLVEVTSRLESQVSANAHEKTNPKVLAKATLDIDTSRGLTAGAFKSNQRSALHTHQFILTAAICTLPGHAVAILFRPGVDPDEPPVITEINDNVTSNPSPQRTQSLLQHVTYLCFRAEQSATSCLTLYQTYTTQQMELLTSRCMQWTSLGTHANPPEGTNDHIDPTTGNS